MSEAAHVLVVEDDPLILMDLEMELSERGFEVSAAANEAAAREVLAKGSINVGVLDMHLRAGPSFELASAFMEAGIPFFFLSGNDRSSLPEHLSEVTIVTKPARMADIVEKIASLAQ